MERLSHEESRHRWLNRSTPLPSLRNLRWSRGWSQEELGRHAGVSAGTVYQLENGRRGAYPATVRKLAAAFQIQPVDLVQERRRKK